MKNIILTILFIALSFIFSFGQSGGDGTSGDPYQIANYADLQWLQTASSEWSKYFIQTADINASATATDGWNPLGKAVFAGTYDGDGYVIDSLTINGAGSLGFIQETDSTTVVKNLGLTNVAITVGDNGYTGALVAYMSDGGTVENCYSTGNIISDAPTRYYYNLGGLIGRAGSGSTISDSYSEVDISNVSVDYPPENVGGFIGYHGGSIINCYATGNIQGGGAVGGFAGTITTGGDITKSYSTGNVTASSSSAGGFVAYNYEGTVSECYSLGNVSGTARVGGFIGYNRKPAAVVSNCYSFGEVTGNVGDHVGGFCGRNYDSATIENCYSTGVSNDKGFMGSSYNNDPVVAACFFDSTTSGNTDDYAVAKTTAEMKTESTFADSSWDLKSTWEVKGNYPNLVNNSNPDLEPIEVAKEIVGQWDFDDADDLTKATIGDDLVLGGTGTAVPGAGEGDGAILLGVGDYLKGVPNIAASGAGEKINTYSLLMDVKLDELGGWVSLLQTDKDNGAENGRDGDWFVWGNEIGIPGAYSDSVFAKETWYRAILVVEEFQNNSLDSIKIEIYLDGTSVFTINKPIDHDTALQEFFYLCSDGTGNEEKPTDVAKVVLYNYAITSEEAEDLGGAGSGIPTGISAEKEIALNSYKLDQNYPNPFNPTTNINFSIAVAGKTTLSVYNVLGQKVATLVNKELSAGSYSYNFNAANLSSGIYIYQLESNNHLEIKKMMLIK